jgi:hypothetical protein
MEVFRIALIALATVAASAFPARPASAASPWQLCLTLDAPGNADSPRVYLLNTVVQGNAIFVTGTYGHDGGNNHGPVVGTLSRSVGLPGPVLFELGLTVMIANGGDFLGPNTENIVFQFHPDGISYKHWVNAGKAFTQGAAFQFACPAS